jgi:multiple sugar transport system permease protein
MASFAETGPSKPVVESIRVDKVTPGARAARSTRAGIVILLAIVGLIPIFVMITTAFKTRSDVVAVPPKIFFQPTLEGFVYLLTERALLPPARLAEAKANPAELDWMEQIALDNGQQITGASQYVSRLWNSVIIAGLSTLFSVVLGLFAAYGFSRFPIAGKNDLLFFILSTRMLPAVVVTIPLFLMYRQLGLHDTHVGMVLLYTAFNLSLSVWLLKGFIDEIPKEYEEAALVDGYTRLQAFRKIVLPQGLHRHRRHHGLQPDLRLERVRLCADAHQRHGPHRTAEHRHHAGARRHRMVGNCRGQPGLLDSGRHRHLCLAQIPAARRHLWRDPPVAASEHYGHNRTATG